MLKIFRSEEHASQLEAACQWLDISKGRASQYIKLNVEFERTCARSEEQLLAYFESYDLVELYKVWGTRAGDFPDLKEKLRGVYKKGPVLSDDEKPSANSNRPRNDSFGLLMAGRFLAAGIPLVEVDGIGLHGASCDYGSDFTFEFNRKHFSVECKRLQSEDQLEVRAKKARQQIVRTGRCGIIAIDCSVLFRPKRTVFENSTNRRAESISSAWMEAKIASRIHALQSSDILGFLLFCRIPVMTPIRIVDKNESRFYRRDCSTSWLGVINPGNTDGSVVEELLLKLQHHARLPSDE